MPKTDAAIQTYTDLGLELILTTSCGPAEQMALALPTKPMEIYSILISDIQSQESVRRTSEDHLLSGPTVLNHRKPGASGSLPSSDAGANPEIHATDPREPSALRSVDVCSLIMDFHD